MGAVYDFERTDVPSRSIGALARGQTGVGYRPDFGLDGETENHGKHRVVDKITQNPKVNLTSLFLQKQGDN